MSKNEDAFNTRLCDYLMECGVLAETQYKTPDGKHLDIRCVVDDSVIVIEAKHGFSNAAKKAAIADVQKRLRSQHGDIAIAVCYPLQYKTKEDLLSGRIYAFIKKMDFTESVQEINWQSITTKQFPSYVKEAIYQLNSPEDLANRAGVAIKKATNCLSPDHQKQFLAAMSQFVRSSSDLQTDVEGLMTDLLTAIMFHGELDVVKNETSFFGKDLVPASVEECLSREDIIKGFINAHTSWLKVDYKQIFNWSCSLLERMPKHMSSGRAVRILADAALTIQRISGNNHHHDLVGITFCQSLQNARYDGSYYTTLPAATLLTNLLFADIQIDWSNYDQVVSLRIVDFACGTGTLLIAAAKYILDHEATGRKKEVARILLEQVLHGFDINNRAIFQSATGLGMISPNVIFKRMHLYSVVLGLEDEKAVLGSLQMLELKEQVFLNPQPSAVVQKVDSKPANVQLGEFDIAIMNPPFTANDKRHQQFDSKTKAKLQAEERKLFKMLPNEMSSNANAFFVLSEQYLDSKTGRMGFIIPLATANGHSAAEIRQYLAEKFHIKYLVVSYDMDRIYFSGNTSIGEMMIIVERHNPSNQDKPTRVLKLTKNPATSSEAIACFDVFGGGGAFSSNPYGGVDLIPKSEMSVGDWRAVQFANNELAKIARMNFWSHTVGNQIELKPLPRSIRGAFKQCADDSLNAVAGLWNNKTDYCNSLELNPNIYVCPNKTPNLAVSQINYLKFPEKLRLTTARIFVCRTTSKSLSNAWVGGKIIPRTPNISARIEDLEKAVVIIPNSTFGKLGMLSNRHNKIPSYPHFSVENLRSIPLPNLDELEPDQIDILVQSYEVWGYKTKLSLPDSHKCEVQASIDRAVCEALNMDYALCEKARHLLVQEPMISG